MEVSKVIGSAFVALGVLGTVVALAWHGTIDGAAATGIISTIISSGVVGGVAVVAHNAGARAAKGQTK